MKHLQLFETFKSQKEIELLANDVIRVCGDLTYDEIFTYLAFKKRNGEENVETPIINIKSVYLKTDIGGNVEKFKKYDELKDFILNSKTVATFSLYNKEYSRNKGSFSNTINREVNVKYTKEFIKELNNKFKEGRVYNGADIYQSLYYETISNLIHELQHSYDDYRSNRKAIKARYDFFDDKKRSFELRNIYDKYADLSIEDRNASDVKKLTDDEIDFINKLDNEYMNQKHEVDARFTQAIKEIRPYKRNKDNIKEVILTDWNDYYSSFKLFFDGWRELSEKDKKRLTRKLSQFYELEKDVVKQKNIDAKNKKDDE